jgi:hypothetical protein
VPVVDEKAHGWIRYLYEHLRVALCQRLAGQVEFWRDLKDIDENELFEPLIEAGLDGSALLLAVVSPAYLGSRWCHKERERFIARRGGPAPDTVERVIKVLKHRLDEDGLPPELRHRTGYRFYLVDPDGRREIPLYFNGKLRREAEYLDRVERLVDYLVERLQAGAPPSAALPELFLALEQGGDASEPALRVRTELAAAGFAVEQPQPAAMTEAEARAGLVPLLARARAAIHVVGRSAGAVLREGRVPAVHLQLEESGRRADRDPAFRRYILVLATHAHGSPDHRAFVDRLQVDLGDGGLLRATDTLVLEQPGGMTVQEFIQIARDGLTT